MNLGQVRISSFYRNQLSNPKPGHTTGGSGRSARRSGRAGSGKIGCQQNYSPRKQKSTVPSKASKKRRFNVSPEARTSEILCKPTEEQNQRLTRGLYRFISGLSAGREALFVPGCRPVERRLFVSVNPFHARHVRESKVSTLDNIQERRSLPVPVMNRSSNVLLYNRFINDFC